MVAIQNSKSTAAVAPVAAAAEEARESIELELTGDQQLIVRVDGEALIITAPALRDILQRTVTRVGSSTVRAGDEIRIAKKRGRQAPVRIGEPAAEQCEISGAQAPEVRAHDLTDLVNEMAQMVLKEKMPSDAVDYFASLGPWVTGASVKQTIGKSWETLGKWRRENKLLAVEFADGNFYYPERQFRDGLPVPEMKAVLDILATAYVAPESQVAWFADEAYEGDDVTRWDLLHRGEADVLVRWAAEDAGRVLV